MNLLTWKTTISQEKTLPYFYNIFSFINKRKNEGINIYPNSKDIFNAFFYTELHTVKVVIIGQDPYNSINQANGLAFSVNPGITPPPSLFNIYKELYNDIPGFIIPYHGCLNNWAKQGILLLNSILTVEEKKAFSHAKIGWEIFTNKVIEIINIFSKGVIFLLWGSYAKKKEAIIDTTRHFILKSSHPSPLSAYSGFFGCKHFSKTNSILIKQNKTPINWNLIKKM